MNEFRFSAYSGNSLVAQTVWMLEQDGFSASNALAVFELQLNTPGLSYQIERRGFSGFSGIPSTALGNSGYSGYSGYSGTGGGASGYSGVSGFSGSGDLNYLHDQTSASATWNVTHSLNKNPSVTVVDTAGTEVVGEVDYLTLNSLTITFTAPFSGKAFLN
jgi:hypothetical protein